MNLEIKSYNRSYLFSYLVDALTIDSGELETKIVDDIIDDGDEINRQKLLNTFDEIDELEDYQTKYKDFIEYVKKPEDSESNFYKVAYHAIINKFHLIHMDRHDNDYTLSNLLELWEYIDSIAN